MYERNGIPSSTAFEIRHSRKHLTVQHKASDDYILWIALDHLYGNGKIYVNKALFKEREFEQAFQPHTRASSHAKVWAEKASRKMAQRRR